MRMIQQFIAVLALALILQRFQPVGGRYSQVIQSLRRIEHPQLAPCHILDRGGKPARTVSVPDFFSLFVIEADNHA